MDAPIDTRQLRAFATLARTGSFTLAGRELHLTQSAVSHAIKALERDMDCQLFHRQGKRVFLTHHGQELLPLAESIFQTMEQARERLGALDHRMRGRLRIGCTTGASQYILPTVLREFKDSFPLYEIRVVPGETPETMERLLNHEIDVSVALRPHDTLRLQCHPIFEDELELLVSPIHPWAKKHPKLKELGDHTLIVSSRNSLTFAMVSEYFLKQGVRLQSFIELGSTEAIKELAKLGIGVAVVARWTVREELKSGQLQAIPLPKGRIKRQWVACALKDRPLSLAETTFIGLCEQVGEKMEK